MISNYLKEYFIKNKISQYEVEIRPRKEMKIWKQKKKY